MRRSVSPSSIQFDAQARHTLIMCLLTTCTFPLVNHIIASPDSQPASDPASQPAPIRDPVMHSSHVFPPSAPSVPQLAHEATRELRAGPSSAASNTARRPLPLLEDLPPPTSFLPFLVAAPEFPTELAEYPSAASSQDFRDEVDALL